MCLKGIAKSLLKIFGLSTETPTAPTPAPIPEPGKEAVGTITSDNELSRKRRALLARNASLLTTSGDTSKTSLLGG